MSDLSAENLAFLKLIGQIKDDKTPAAQKSAPAPADTTDEEK
jgi:hypothetical protein